jgi:hypothetical protein
MFGKRKNGYKAIGYELIETSNRVRTNDCSIAIAVEKGALKSRQPKMRFELIG